MSALFAILGRQDQHTDHHPPTMGSYASIMNDVRSNGMEVDVYIKFTTQPPVPVTGLALVTETVGVVAAVPVANVNGEINVILDQDSALDVLGADPGALSLGPLLAAAIRVTAEQGGYLLLPQGAFLRSDNLPISSAVYAQVLTIAVNSNSSVSLFAGSSNLTTAAMANGDTRTLFVESILGGLDTRIATPIASTDPTAAGLIDQYEAMIQAEDTSVFTTQIKPSVLPCAFMAPSLD
ncbi:hypothetical protein C8R45DRAFT_946272 [Mycena sanguinolenta]|nr:hypothetical protein C8R45DRAFT_946272 [Mycena sanguinolenta]